MNQNLAVVEVASCHREVEVAVAPEAEPQLDGLEKKASLVELEEDDWGLKDCHALEAHHQIRYTARLEVVVVGSPLALEVGEESRDHSCRSSCFGPNTHQSD